MSGKLIAAEIPWNELRTDEKTFLCSGSYGEVFKVKWIKKDKNIAAKHFKGSEARVSKELENEVKNLLRVKHPNIITLYGITKDSYSKPYLLMEYADCGSLHQFLHGEGNKLKKMSYLALHNLMLQLAKGVVYLHDLEPKVIHRDLKPSNLLLTNDYRTLKICDFGTVRALASKMTQDKGTTCYMAPEVAMNKGRYTEKCDVYSFGIILWEVFSNQMPYSHMKNQTDVAIQYKVFYNDERPLLEHVNIKDRKCRESMQFLITQCWDKEPSRRPSMNTLSFFLSKDPNSKKHLPEPTSEDYLFAEDTRNESCNLFCPCFCKARQHVD